MSSTKKKLEELNVIDDFLMNRLASDASIGEEFCRLLLSTLQQRKTGKVAVMVQKVIPPFSPERKGIRMDVRVEEAAEHAFTENIKIRPEVRESYMLWEEYEEMMKEKGRQSRRKQGNYF